MAGCLLQHSVSNTTLSHMSSMRHQVMIEQASGYAVSSIVRNIVRRDLLTWAGHDVITCMFSHMGICSHGHMLFTGMPIG